MRRAPQDQATEAKAKKRKIAKNSLNRSIGSVSLEVSSKPTPPDRHAMPTRVWWQLEP